MPNDELTGNANGDGEAEERPSQEELDAACDKDRQFQRCLAKCRERYERYLKLFELFNEKGQDND